MKKLETYSFDYDDFYECIFDLVALNRYWTWASNLTLRAIYPPLPYFDGENLMDSPCFNPKSFGFDPLGTGESFQDRLRLVKNPFVGKRYDELAKHGHIEWIEWGEGKYYGAISLAIAVRELIYQQTGYSKRGDLEVDCTAELDCVARIWQYVGEPKMGLRGKMMRAIEGETWQKDYGRLWE